MTSEIPGETDRAADRPPRFVRAVRALRDRRMAAMLLLSFAAGLPFGAVLGTLNAWLTEEQVTPSAIGALSIITLGYAFKYIWAPLFQSARSPVPGGLGPRRNWLLAFQLPIAALLGLLAMTDPSQALGTVALIALAIALLSATHDIVLDAWRIEVARSDEDRDLMSALYQFGYRTSGFITGFLALLLAERFGFLLVYGLIAGMMMLSIAGTLIAPEPDLSRSSPGSRPSFLARIPRIPRNLVTGLVALGWGVAVVMIVSFVSLALTADPPPSGRDFVRNDGRWIVGLTVIVPALIATFLVLRYARAPAETQAPPGEPTSGERALNSLFRAIFDPLMELISRLRWGALLVLALALTYRFTDAVWGAFAYPFYLDDRFGALGHSMADVAVASKFFGVLMTIAGAGLGAVVIAAIGRMPVLVIGAVLAAATNLLFADLAAGGAVMDWTLEATRLGVPLRAFAEWAAALSVEAAGADQSQRMARLMLAIAGENLAGGFASVAMVAFLTSVVNARFAAVQYALLGSLTMLIGTLGRPWLGEIIEGQGYFDVFIITALLGLVAVILSLLEWARQAREARKARARQLSEAPPATAAG